MEQRFSFYSRQQSQALLERLKTRQKIKINFEYLIIDSEAHLERWVKEIENNSSFIALDTETKGLLPASGMVKTLQLAYQHDFPVLIIYLDKIQNKDSLQRLLSNPRILKVAHYLKFDALMLEAEGIEIKPPMMCTMLAIKVLKAGATGQANLQFAARELLNLDLDKSEQSSDWTGELSLEQLQYAANDAGILVKLMSELQSRLERAGLNTVAILEYCCLPAIIQMQGRGIYLARQRWHSVRYDYEQRRDRLGTEIHEQLGRQFNIVSARQLLAALQQYGIKIESTNSNVLIEQVKQYPIIAKIIKYRRLNATINTFLKGYEQHLQPDSRLRGNWWQIGTRTGRTSSSEPNLSNIPKIPQIRACFAASRGYLLIDADYSQIELRLAAKRMAVPTLIEAFKQGRDIHALTASYIYDCELEELKPEQRKLGKILNLGLIYGMGAEKFRLNAAKKFNVYLSLERARELRKLFFTLYPEIERYHQNCRRNWQQGQQQARSTLGRLNIWSSKSPKLNQLINYPIQADCADLLKRAIANWYLESNRHQFDAYLVLTAYDQLVIEVIENQAPLAAEILEQIMIEAGEDLLEPIPVIVDIKVGKYWS